MVPFTTALMDEKLRQEILHIALDEGDTQAAFDHMAEKVTWNFSAITAGLVMLFGPEQAADMLERSAEFARANGHELVEGLEAIVGPIKAEVQKRQAAQFN